MTVTIPQVEAANPEGLTQAGHDIGRSANVLGERISAQQRTLDDLRAHWQGTASDAAIAKATVTLHRMQRMQDSMTNLQSVLETGGGQLSRSCANILSTVGQLQQQGWQVAPDGTVSIRPGSVLDRAARMSMSNAMKLMQAAAVNSLTVKTLLAEFDSTDRQVGENVRRTVLGLDVHPVTWNGDRLPQQPAEETIPEGKSAEEVKQWWDRLSDADKERLPREHPDKLGNLDGIPVAARSVANKTVMERDIARVENATGPVSEQDMIRYRNALKVREGLTVQAEEADAETFLYVYEPEAFDGQGRAALTIGNPDTADNTAVLVPGTGNSVESGWLTSQDITEVYDQTSKADKSKSTAVVAWMGYDAPDSPGDPRIAEVGLARQGGELMAADVNALAVTNDGDSNVTVIGHSYGSTTVADAAAGYGMQADNVVLVGSPGTDLAKSAADFNLPEGGHVFVGASSADLVTQLGALPQVSIPDTELMVGLGNDPSVNDFGSTRFKAEVPGLPSPLGDHTRYFERGRESLYSIATIASGNGEKLEDLGMTANHRVELDMLPLPPIRLGDPRFDPEAFRRATDGHIYE
ncbi:alpha/beta hydrolase [Mycolicibacterium thermoresistibile]